MVMEIHYFLNEIQKILKKSRNGMKPWIDHCHFPFPEATGGYRFWWAISWSPRSVTSESESSRYLMMRHGVQKKWLKDVKSKVYIA